MRRMEMLKAREILRLKHEVGLSLREIAQACSCGKSSVSEILDRSQKAHLEWPTDLSDKQLMSLLYPPSDGRISSPEPDLEHIFCEMKKKSVTLMLLWEEYKKAHPDGIMYTQFCERYRKFKTDNRISMHKEHKAGETVEVDWCGDKMTYMDRETGGMKDAYIFVAVLPASNYPFVYAYPDMKTPNWIDAHVRTYEYFGGVPRITISDNTKTAVIKPDLVDPVLNKSYHEMARHYRTTLIPARPYKPKDKASDENAVLNVSRRIIAALRNRKFFGIADINDAIDEELEKFVNRPFQKMEGNRLSTFEKIDKPNLQPLPSRKYEYSEWKEAKVQFNYHIEFENFFYSVHFTHVNKPCSIRTTARTIEVYIDNERVAAHPRNFNKYARYTTLPEHMPESHKMVYGWNSERYLSWAQKVGVNTRELISRLLESREYPVQTYRACMGIMRFSNSYSNEVMEEASRMALENSTVSYKYFSMIIKQSAFKAVHKLPEKIVEHENIRGKSAYAGGGIHA